jgi:hypothetical protein
LDESLGQLLLKPARNGLVVFSVHSEISLGNDAFGVVVSVLVANPASQLPGTGIVPIAKVFGNGHD